MKKRLYKGRIGIAGRRRLAHFARRGGPMKGPRSAIRLPCAIGSCRFAIAAGNGQRRGRISFPASMPLTGLAQGRGSIRSTQRAGADCLPHRRFADSDMLYYRRWDRGQRGADRPSGGTLRTRCLDGRGNIY